MRVSTALTTTKRATAVLALTLLAATAAAAMPAGAQELTLHQRDLVEDAMAPKMVLPETAIWEFGPFKPYLGTTKLVCGRVNYQSAMRQYVGFHRFYALMDGEDVTLIQIQDDPTDPSGKLRAKLDFLCGKP
jgi:hypothetical protein